jgi:hypothetical protein
VKTKLVLWLGGVDGQRYSDPDELIEESQPYPSKYDPEILRRELMKDKTPTASEIIFLMKTMCLAKPASRTNSRTPELERRLVQQENGGNFCNDQENHSSGARRHRRQHRRRYAPASP